MYMLYLKPKLNTHLILLYKMHNAVNIEGAINHAISKSKLAKDESLILFERAIDRKFNNMSDSINKMVTYEHFQEFDGTTKEVFQKILTELMNIQAIANSMNMQMQIHSENNNDVESSIASGVVHKRVESRVGGKQSINMFFKDQWVNNEVFRTDSNFAFECSAIIEAGKKTTGIVDGNPEKMLKKQAISIWKLLSQEDKETYIRPLLNTSQEPPPPPLPIACKKKSTRKLALTTVSDEDIQVPPILCKKKSTRKPTTVFDEDSDDIQVPPILCKKKSTRKPMTVFDEDSDDIQVPPILCKKKSTRKPMTVFDEDSDTSLTEQLPYDEPVIKRKVIRNQQSYTYDIDSDIPVATVGKKKNGKKSTTVAKKRINLVENHNRDEEDNEIDITEF